MTGGLADSSPNEAVALTCRKRSRTIVRPIPKESANRSYHHHSTQRKRARSGRSICSRFHKAGITTFEVRGSGSHLHHFISAPANPANFRSLFLALVSEDRRHFLLTTLEADPLLLQ